ncbi:MAG: hypothetical protein AB7L66_00465 [Gemmatimonadales bacterium]
MSRPVVALGTLLALAAAGTPAAAQGRTIEITPFVGGFLPTTSLGQATVNGPGGVPITSVVEMRTGAALGGRIGVYGPGRLGAEAEYFYATSDLAVRIGPFPEVIDASVQGGSVRLTYRATSEGSGTDLSLNGGLGAMYHSGRAFTLASNQLDLGGVVGGGLRVEISSQVTLRFDASLYAYNWSYGIAGFDSKLQTDAVVSAGLALKLGR